MLPCTSRPCARHHLIQRAKQHPTSHSQVSNEENTTILRALNIRFYVMFKAPNISHQPPTSQHLTFAGNMLRWNAWSASPNFLPTISTYLPARNEHGRALALLYSFAKTFGWNIDSSFHVTWWITLLVEPAPSNPFQDKFYPLQVFLEPLVLRPPTWNYSFLDPLIWNLLLEQ